ncbi:MAG: UrcA family protein [Caulobacteraceae bacterium]
MGARPCRSDRFPGWPPPPASPPWRRPAPPRPRPTTTRRRCRAGGQRRPHRPPGAEIRAIRIRADDLNLFGQPGAFALIGRIQGAARQVCAPEPSAVDLRDMADYRRCVADAVERAVHDTGEPLVIAIHDLGAATRAPPCRRRA